MADLTCGAALSDRRLLITAGPTHEPIDAVRYIANRSSGRLGLVLAEVASRRGVRTTLLLGPTHLGPSDSTRFATHRFTTTSDLQALLAEHWPSHDILIMAAAVADYRPRTPVTGKLRRAAEAFAIELEPTPDLLAGLDALTRPGQYRVGFALEPESELIARARSKLASKHLDAIVANPLATMDADSIDGVLVTAAGETHPPAGLMPKSRFAAWLLDEIEGLVLTSSDDHE